MRWTFTALACASLVTFAGCGGLQPNGIGSPTSLPDVSRAASSTIVKTVSSTGHPISGLEVELRRGTTRGPLIAKGKTNRVGRVQLSGNFGTGDVCADAIWQGQSAQTCQKPFPHDVVLKFQ